MSRCLFRVEDSLAIRGRGVVLIPGIEPRERERLKAGDPIRILRPDGTTLDTRIAGLEMFTCTTATAIPSLLPQEIASEDVPLGSEIWASR